MTDTRRFYGETLARELSAKFQYGTVALAAGTATVSARLTTTSTIQLTRNTAGGTVTNTIMYAAPAASRSTSNSTFGIIAAATTGTANTADESILDWFVIG